MSADLYAALRRQMLAEIAAETVFSAGETGRAAIDSRVLEVLERVPRHEFVPVELQPYAYANTPLPIGYDKTISQPFIVALMVDLLELRPEDAVLEIGTGLGYGAAVLSRLAARVYSMEIVEELAAEAKKRLARLGFENVELRLANGFHGWHEHAPFDKVIVTAAPELLPPPLLRQLKPGGRMVIPAGLAEAQKLMLVEKDGEGKLRTREVLRVRFTRLEGTAEGF